MDEKELERIEQVCNAASPPPWLVEDGSGIIVPFEGGLAQIATMAPTSWAYPDGGKNHRLRELGSANSDLMINAPTWLPALVEEVHRWKAWEKSWILGTDAEWPGDPGTTDPRVEHSEMVEVVAGLQADVRRLRRALDLVEKLNVKPTK